MRNQRDRGENGCNVSSTKSAWLGMPPRPVREVAVLVTGAKFRPAYEIYAHVILAEQRGLSDKELSTIV